MKLGFVLGLCFSFLTGCAAKSIHYSVENVLFFSDSGQQGIRAGKKLDSDPHILIIKNLFAGTVYFSVAGISDRQNQWSVYMNKIQTLRLENLKGKISFIFNFDQDISDTSVTLDLDLRNKTKRIVIHDDGRISLGGGKSFKRKGRRSSGSSSVGDSMMRMHNSHLRKLLDGRGRR